MLSYAGLIRELSERSPSSVQEITARQRASASSVVAALELLRSLNIARRLQHQDWRTGTLRTRWVLLGDAASALASARRHGIDVDAPLPCTPVAGREAG